MCLDLPAVVNTLPGKYTGWPLSLRSGCDELSQAAGSEQTVAPVRWVGSPNVSPLYFAASSRHDALGEKGSLQLSHRWTLSAIYFRQISPVLNVTAVLFSLHLQQQRQTFGKRPHHDADRADERELSCSEPSRLWDLVALQHKRYEELVRGCWMSGAAHAAKSSSQAEKTCWMFTFNI